LPQMPVKQIKQRKHATAATITTKENDIKRAADTSCPSIFRILLLMVYNCLSSAKPPDFVASKRVGKLKTLVECDTTRTQWIATTCNNNNISYRVDALKRPHLSEGGE